MHQLNANPVLLPPFPFKIGFSISWKLVNPIGWNLEGGGGDNTVTFSPLETNHANIAEAPFIYVLHAFDDFLRFKHSGRSGIIKGPIAVVSVCM